MKLTGSTDLTVPVEVAFERLLDADLLARCIPGCERMEEVEPGVYDTSVKAGVGAVRGSFQGRVTLSDVVRPESYRIALEGKSTVGYVKGHAIIRLEEGAAGARIHYEGEAKVSGLMAAVGSRLLESAGRNVAGQFFDRVRDEIAASDREDP